MAACPRDLLRVHSSSAATFWLADGAALQARLSARSTLQLNEVGMDSGREPLRAPAQEDAAQQERIPRIFRQARIPRIVHTIWLGGPLPARLRRVVASWAAVHPDWRHVHWDDAALAAASPLFNAAAAAAARDQGGVSDVLRLEVLHAVGGVYADVDMLCLGRLDKLTEVGRRRGGGGTTLPGALQMAQARVP
jgi:mannosyltransferase OCH1-like enzyme